MPTENSADKQVFARRESEVRSYCRSFDTVFTSASGSEMTDVEGKTYIDFLAGCSSLNYGHNDADMKAALIEHIQNDGIAHGLVPTLDTVRAGQQVGGIQFVGQHRDGHVEFSLQEDLRGPVGGTAARFVGIEQQHDTLG